jgi:hypothetical protein
VSYDRHSALTGPEPLESRECPAVAWHGGRVLAHPNAHVVLYGGGWMDGGDRQLDGQRLAWDVQALASGPYADALSAYGVGRGTAADPVALDAPLNGRGWLDDSLIQHFLRPMARGTGPDDVWVVFVEPGAAVSVGVGSVYGSRNSQSDFAGYHSLLYDGAAFHPYCVIPWPGPVDGSPWPNLPAWGPAFQRGHGLALGTFDEITGAASHEFAEAATDPRGDGWWDARYGPAGGEVGDLAAGDVFIYRSFLVQAFAGPDGRPVRVVE